MGGRGGRDKKRRRGWRGGQAPEEKFSGRSPGIANELPATTSTASSVRSSYMALVSGYRQQPTWRENFFVRLKVPSINADYTYQ